MSVQDQIDRLSGAKSDIAAAIENKGVTVPTATALDGMAALINDIDTTGATGPTGPTGATGATGPTGPAGEISKTTLLNWVYPVGSIYMSVNSTSPASRFGGTWQRIQNCFLLASGSAYTAGTTGGEATHTLTVDEIPSHNHGNWYELGNNASSKYLYGGSGYGDITRSTTNVGGGAAHNNMPPYLAVYVWKRTA